MTEWENRMMNHPNELCRDTQLQIGFVQHLQPHLKSCRIENSPPIKGLSFVGPKTECIPYFKMCDDSSPFVVEDCPPLSRILKSRFFCRNVTNFLDEEAVCFPGFYRRCHGNSPSVCYLPAVQCSDQGGFCNDKSHYICPKDANITFSQEEIDGLSITEKEIRFFESTKRHNFTKCRSDGHFVCSDGLKCIHKTLKCDGYRQCDDGSDEGYSQCGTCP